MISNNLVSIIMKYYCKLCDETKKRISKNKHFKSENHIPSENSFISRYII